MKIERIESFLIGGGHVVRLTTDNGLSGVGQTACWGYPEAVRSIVSAFERYLIGQDPLRIEHHWQHLYRMSPFRGTALAGAVSAVDIALWDIKGKHYQAPVWELLGGRCRDRIRLHLLGGADTPEAMREHARSAAEEGFTALKFDPVHHIDAGIDRMVTRARDLVAAAREGGGPDLDLIVEVHRKLTPMTAWTLAEALRPFNLFFLEDPIQIDSIQTQAQVARRSNVPVGNGERLTTIWEFRELLESGGPQYVRPDVGLAGGLTQCRKIAAIAEVLPLRRGDPQLPRSAAHRRFRPSRREHSELHHPGVHQGRRVPVRTPCTAAPTGAKAGTSPCPRSRVWGSSWWTS